MPTNPAAVLHRLRARSGRRAAAWVVPIAVIGAVGVGAALVAPSSDAVPTLPARTAAQLLTQVQQHAAGTALSGQVREIANLGFPALPGPASAASLSWQTFVTGSHSARVWIDGVGRQRVALIGELSEADVTHNGRDVWTYTSSTNTATHSVLPAPDATHDQLPATATPAGVAAQVLKAIDPTTAVTVQTAQRVAGRAAYTLVLSPRDTRSTVREVRIAIDASTYVPLQLQVFAAGSKPAFQIGYTSVSFARPAASNFAFLVPRGATVSDDPLGTRSDGEHQHPGRLVYHGAYRGHLSTKPAYSSTLTITPDRSSSHPSVIGKGWTSVIEFPQGVGSTGGLLDQLTTRIGSSGTRLLHTALLNAVFLPDGRVFVGAVSPSLLEHIAGTTH